MSDLAGVPPEPPVPPVLTGPLRLIVNPKAGAGGMRARALALTAALDEHGADFDVVESAGKHHAGELARTALDEGLRRLVCVGGDGTLHEVVNGMFDERRPVAPDAVLGVFGAGSGCDFVRTFGLDLSAKRIADHLLGPHHMTIDVGVASFHDRHGQPREELFVNVAQVGYGGHVVRTAARLPRRLGRLRYLLGAWRGILAVEKQTTPVAVDHTTRELGVVDLVAANCQFFGGGMKVAPRALPDDGKLNVLVFTGERGQVFGLTTKLFQGEHLPHPAITEWQSSTVSIAPESPMPVEADGELLGFTPASFSLMPQSLTLKI